MPKKISFVSQGLNRRASPLIFHLLKGYAETDPEIRRTCVFTSLDVPQFDNRDHARWIHIARVRAEQILQSKPDLIAFSLYSWNSRNLLQIAALCKQLAPEVEILVGGPDTFGTHTAEKLLHKWPELDYVLSTPGGGELAFKVFLQYWACGTVKVGQVPWQSYRVQGQVITNGAKTSLENLDEIPSGILTYRADELTTPMLRNRNHFIDAVILETSRSCAMGCIYCQYTKGTREKTEFSIQRILTELEHVRKEGISEIYFADGIFTYHKERAARFFSYFLETFTTANIHCEVKLDILPSDLIAPMKELLRQQRLHIGIGIQSVNPEVLNKIKRKTNFPKFESNVKALFGSHGESRWDLIYGLPGDTFQDQLKGIDYIHSVMPTANIILRPLQILPGTEIADLVDKYEIVSEPDGPYRIFSTKTLSFEDRKKCDMLIHLVRLSQKTRAFMSSVLKQNLPSTLFQDIFAEATYFNYVKSRGLDDSVWNAFTFSNGLRKYLANICANQKQRTLLDEMIDLQFLKLLAQPASTVDPACLILPSLLETPARGEPEYRYRFHRGVTDWPHLKVPAEETSETRDFVFHAGADHQGSRLGPVPTPGTLSP